MGNKLDLKLKVTFAVIMLLAAINVSAANKKATIYAFGFSASFNDSIVYFTDIQQIDNATIESKSKFLLNRAEYADQFRDYFNSIGLEHRTCIISYGLTLKDAEKKLVKLRKRYSKGGHYKIKYLAGNDFKFRVISHEELATELPIPKIDENKKKEKKLPEGNRPVADDSE
ncbi:hypothetical protein [Prevotella sp. KH2C16]|uniref:hypothetical protein n=1 Tax=Prevotella sp. KH2C16 TaxID=1855325 RepID=UPI0008EB8FD5|nr:hypothetical protein [Prevotella sp. KH2C16]SFG12074.1 hypothetical protein SAMN05216383_105139 [Prevotella sp. KH2C16]